MLEEWHCLACSDQWHLLTCVILIVKQKEDRFLWWASCVISELFNEHKSRSPSSMQVNLLIQQNQSEPDWGSDLETQYVQ